MQKRLVVPLVGGPRRSLLQTSPSGGGGALLRIHSGAAVKGELCGVGLLLTESGTAFTGGPSIFISVSHSKATLASRFLDGFPPPFLHDLHFSPLLEQLKFLGRDPPGPLINFAFAP